MNDVVREYLRSKDYADHVIRGGLEGLVRMWEHTVESVATGVAQDRDEYLNDMDGRRILEEALAIAPVEGRALWVERVQAADVKIRPHLKPSQECLWGDDNARKYGDSRERDWWYYYEPKAGLY
jgi:hypothetical protein